MTTVGEKLFTFFVAVFALPSLARGFLNAHPLADPANLFSSEDQSFEYIQQELNRLMQEKQETQIPIGYNSEPIFLGNILFVPGHEKEPQSLLPDDPTSVDNSYLNNALPLDIVIGDGSLSFELPMFYLRSFGLPKTQMLFVVWKLEDFHNYTARVEGVPVIADYTVRLINSIQASNKPISSSDMHFITFGMGAHAAGVVANKVKDIGVITGINPPALHFKKAPKHLKLDKNDADYVVVIHTSDLAIKKPMGDIDYYVVFGDSYNQHPYSTLRNFDHCYNKLAAIAYPTSILVPYMAHVEGISAYKCKSAKKWKRDKCLKNKVAPFGYFANTAMKGKYYLQLDSFNSTLVLGNNVLTFPELEYCEDRPIFVRIVAVQMWTSSPRNQGFIMANSYAEIAEIFGQYARFNFTSTYKEILNSKATSPGMVSSYLNVPLFVPVEYIRFQLRYSNRLDYAGNFTIDRMLFTIKNGTQEVNYRACNIELKPFAKPTTLDLRLGINC